MKIRKPLLALAFLAICCILCSCGLSESSDSSTTNNTLSNIKYKDGYEVAQHENFSSVEGFRETDIYLEATITKFESHDLFLTDAEGFEWVVIGLYEHDFSERIGEKCVCYCKSEGIYAMNQDIVIISFDDRSDYGMILNDGTIYSEFDNCTMHVEYDDAVAFGGSVGNNSEYHIIDTKNAQVRYLRFENGQWYYADGVYSGLIYHKAKVVYTDALFETIEISNDQLTYFINNGTGIRAPRKDIDTLQEMVSYLMNDGSAINLCDGSENKISDNLFEVNKDTDSETTSDASNKDENTELSPEMVWIPTNGGTKYHTRSNCSQMENPKQVTKEYAEKNGFTPCERCH